MAQLLRKDIEETIMMHQPQIRRYETGFTLIEVMVVIGIIAILAGAAIPGFSAWLPRYRLKSAVQDLYSNMQLAKMNAVRTGQNSIITFNPGSGTYTKADGTLVTLSDYGSGIEYGRGNATQGVGGEPFGDFVTYVTPDNVASFNSRGMGNNVGNGYVYFTVRDKDLAYAVGSLSSGVVFLRRWNGSDWQ
jgi:prepilin-type N-terminal cleavage/methylation domain-containing protein